jgi:hypothetical protein
LGWQHLGAEGDAIAGLDIVTDGDSRFDLAVGGKSWFSIRSSDCVASAPQDPNSASLVPASAERQVRRVRTQV